MTTGNLLSRTWLHTLLVVLSTVLFIFIVYFVQTTFSAPILDANNRLSALDVSTTLAVLRAAQGLLSLLTSATLSTSFAFLMWGKMNRPAGFGYLSILAMSATTGYIGAFNIIFSRMSKWPTKLWAALRIALNGAVALSGVVLFVNTSFTTAYYQADVYNVTAGLGAFNGSYVSTFLDSIQSMSPQYKSAVVPYSFTAISYNLVANQIHSTVCDPINCRGDYCRAYLMSGGSIMLTPWTHTNFPSYPLLMAHNVPSIHVEFENNPAITDFSATDCDFFGSTGILIAARVCIRNSKETNRHLDIALFVCQNSADTSKCGDLSTAANITTTVAFYTRWATVVASRSNYSIIQVSDLEPAVPVSDLDLPAYRRVFSWLLNYTAAGIPAPSSIIGNFWASQDEMRDLSARASILENFESIIAFPFWFFNANNYGNTALRTHEMVSTLPPQFYTQASIVAPHEQIRVDRAMFVLFAILQGLALCLPWVVLVWLWITINVQELPEFSSYPLFDVGFKSEAKVVEDSAEIMKADDTKVIAMVKDTKVRIKKGG